MLIDSRLAAVANTGAAPVGAATGTAFLRAAGGVSTLGTTDGAWDGAGGADDLVDRAGPGAATGVRLKIFARAPNMFGRRQSKPRARTGVGPKKTAAETAGSRRQIRARFS